MPTFSQSRIVARRSTLDRWTAAATSMLIALTLTMVFSGCQSAPLLGRSQLVLISESQEIALGQQAYAKILAEEPPSQNKQLAAMVNRVGQRIADAADKPDYDWEFRVIAKNEKNAFALPGGKVAIYEGIIPLCQDEAGLAVVMSHEIAHALARHGGERMSQQAVAAGVGGAINAVGQQNADRATTEKIMQVYGAASTYGVILPFSRRHESEADAIGLILMAKAGYDPSVAPEFWERFASLSRSKPPELLSTHPADVRRAADLRSMLPEAMNYYDAAPVQLGMGDVLPAIHRTQTLAKSDPQPLPARQMTAKRASGAPAKASQRSPTSPPKAVEPSNDIQTVAFSEPSAEPEPFRLPVAKGERSSTGTEPYQPPAEWSQPADDGWQPARGRAVIHLDRAASSASR